jgi:hypothetical protein
VEDRLEKIAEAIELHISVLVDYDVIEAQVGDTLSGYVRSIVLADEKQATVSTIGENNEVHILGPVGLKHNWPTT